MKIKQHRVEKSRGKNNLKNENVNTAYQDVWGAAKQLKREVYSNTQYIKKKFQINNLTLYLKELENRTKLSTKLAEERK